MSIDKAAFEERAAYWAKSRHTSRAADEYSVDVPRLLSHIEELEQEIERFVALQPHQRDEEMTDSERLNELKKRTQTIAGMLLYDRFGQFDLDDVRLLLTEIERHREILAQLVNGIDEWNDAVVKVIGRHVEYTWPALEEARALVREGEMRG